MLALLVEAVENPIQSVPLHSFICALSQKYLKHARTVAIKFTAVMSNPGGKMTWVGAPGLVESFAHRQEVQLRQPHSYVQSWSFRNAPRDLQNIVGLMSRIEYFQQLPNASTLARFFRRM